MILQVLQFPEPELRVKAAPYREGDGYRVTTHAKIGTGTAPGR